MTHGMISSLSSKHVAATNFVITIFRLCFLWVEWEFFVPQLYGIMYISWFFIVRNKESDMYGLSVALVSQGLAEILLSTMGQNFFFLQILGQTLLIVSRLAILYESVDQNIYISNSKLVIIISLTSYFLYHFTLVRNSTMLLILSLLNCCLLSLKKKPNSKFVIGCNLYVFVDILRIIDWFYLKKFLLKGFGGKQVFNLFSVLGLHTYPGVTFAFRAMIELLQQLGCFYLCS